ncbi:two-component response regulator ORR21-like protein [Cinnamomum micranthum f. kanehirae]|uniref:Two-component response regulator ORR21-like protein n=1 Tax=Cinnamomum micranthum f. kanehirae TaxID=337451 RepID=A0A3S3NL90_9MAGN|nr:two-component response regulator ORR21-like protein [Cinnamomum micranthum f. kanehirae]
MKDFSSMESEGDLSSSSTLCSVPFRLHILVVDDDPTYLMVLAKMLRKRRYEVTTCEHATIALSLLRGKRAKYDIVLTDVHMPDVDGFKLLEIVGLEMDLPVLMMSADCDMNVAMRGLECGACYYFVKPISIHEIKNIWQHLIRKKKIDNKEIGQIGSVGKVEVENTSKKALEDGECASTVHEGSSEKHYKRKNQVEEDEDGGDDSEEHRVQRQPRIRWHLLHNHFASLVNLIGIDRAEADTLLELMDVPGLTREDVATHLEIYRLYLHKVNENSLASY